AVVGANGSGKSSLLSIISGFLTPYSGRVLYEGTPVSELACHKDLRNYRAQIGLVHQGLNLVGRLTVLENVLIGRLGKNHSLRSWFRIFNSQDRNIAESALGRVGLSHKRHQRTD